MLDKNVYDYRVREKCSTETRVYFCALCANATDEISTARHWGFGTFRSERCSDDNHWFWVHGDGKCNKYGVVSLLSESQVDKCVTLLANRSPNLLTSLPLIFNSSSNRLLLLGLLLHMRKGHRPTREEFSKAVCGFSFQTSFLYFHAENFQRETISSKPEDWVLSVIRINYDRFEHTQCQKNNNIGRIKKYISSFFRFPDGLRVCRAVCRFFLPL